MYFSQNFHGSFIMNMIELKIKTMTCNKDKKVWYLQFLYVHIKIYILKKKSVIFLIFWIDRKKIKLLWGMKNLKRIVCYFSYPPGRKKKWINSEYVKVKLFGKELAILIINFSCIDSFIIKCVNYLLSYRHPNSLKWHHIKI